MTGVVSYAYLGVQSPRLDAWRAFGPGVLGMELAGHSTAEAVYLRVDDRAHRLAVHAADSDGLRYLGWEVANPDELEAFADRLKRFGFETTPGTPAELADRRVRGLVWFVDHDGFRHEFVTGHEVGRTRLRPGRAHAGFVTGEAGLGHVAIGVPNLAAAGRFYTDVLGFSLTDEIDAHVPMRFFHVNRRHHSIAVVGTPGRTGLFHLQLQVAELDDVGIAMDLCQTTGGTVKRTLGRHPNDRTVSCYLGTPSGFDIEYGWGPIELGPEQHVATYMTTASTWGHVQLAPSSCLPVATD